MREPGTGDPLEAQRIGGFPPSSRIQMAPLAARSLRRNAFKSRPEALVRSMSGISDICPYML